MPPEICPECGAIVPANARACPDCGADEQTGWSERAARQRLGIHDEEDFDYKEYVKEEFDRKPDSPAARIHWLWWIAALVLVLIFLFGYFR